MMQARRTYGDKVFALVGSHTVVYAAEDLARILDIRMRCYERHSDQDLSLIHIYTDYQTAYRQIISVHSK